MIEYQKILDKNMLNVFKDILKNIKDNGLSNNNHLYVTFITNHKNVELPNWLKQKYPQEMTIIIQYEYYDLEINKNNFSITLSFADIKTNLKINYNAIVSFADPSANFGLILQKSKIQKKVNKKLENNKSKKDNVIIFSNYKNIIDTVEEVLIDFNKDIVNSLKKLGSEATSFHTKTSNVIEVEPERKELGFVGKPNEINKDIIKNVLEKKMVPIISPLGLKDNQTYNINGDTAAGAIAKSLKARRLILMTNIEGVLNKQKNLIEEITSTEILQMIKDETITEGMIPKINTCLDAVNNGVTGVVIVDGRKPHSILFEIFSDKGAGTLIRK